MIFKLGGVSRWLFIFVCFVSFAENIFLCAETDGVVEKGDFNIGSMQDLYQEMIKIWVEAKKREDDRKALFFSKLYESHQELLKKAQNMYEEFLEDVDIRNGLVKLCHELHGRLEKLKDRVPNVSENSEYSVLNDVLIKIEKLQEAIALDSCPFLPRRMNGMNPSGGNDLSGLVNGLMQNIENGGGNEDFLGGEDLENPDYLFSKEDLSGFCESLIALINSNVFRFSKTEDSAGSLLKNKTEQLAKLLNDILSCFLNNRQNELALHYMEYLAPRLGEISALLNNTRRVFEEEVKGRIAKLSKNAFEDISSDENAYNKAYVFWLKEIKKNQRALLVFSKLKEDLNSDIAGTAPLFNFVAYSYDFVSCLYNFYKKDMSMGGHGAFSKELLIPRAIDWGFSGAMAAWYFFLERPNATSGVLLQAIYGNIPPNMIGTKDFMVTNSMAATVSIFVLFDPSVWNMQPKKLSSALGKALGSWVYYYWIYGEWFGNAHSFCWPSDYRHLKKSTYNLLREFEKIVSMHIASVIRNKTDPVKLEAIERNTLGIVNPEMLWYFVDTMTPLILFNNFEASARNPIFGSYDNDLFITRSVSDDYEHFSDEDKRRVSLKSFYVETCISYYIASCVGRTLGAAITRKVQGPALSSLSYISDKFLDGLAALHIIGSDTRELFTATKEELVEGIDESIMILKMLFREILAPNSQLRLVLISQLERRGTISTCEDSSVENQNKELLRLVLKHCMVNHLITHLDAARIMRSFLEKQQIDDTLIDNIIISLKNNVLASWGGWLGSYLATWGVDLLTRKKGPMQLYPSKISAWMTP
jgi:hypothetical protein